MAKQLSLFVLGIVFATTCYGVPPIFMTYGVGMESCGTHVQDFQSYLASPNSPANWIGYNSDVSWLDGFFTDKPFTRQVDVAGIEQWVFNYCQQHPLDTLETAATQLPR